MSTMKRIQRITQRTAEVFGRSEKSDKLTSKLTEIERKVEGIRNGCQVTTKKLTATFVGSGSTLEKHQKRIPQYTLGVSMMESGTALGQSSLFGQVLQMVGQAQQDIASQMSHYEISVMHDIISDLNTMLEDDMKKVDKAKKKLSGARLDMDAAKNRLKFHEQHNEKSTREYNMEKLQALRQEVDDTSKVFEDCQDAYATEMFDFLSKEHLYTEKIQMLVKLQITHYKNAAAQLEGMLPTFEKKMNESLERPVFGVDLDEHLSHSKRDIAMVLDVCCTALRKNGMDTEGLFRIGAGSAKVKFLKSGLDAGQTDMSAHDPHTIAGCLKMYLRELPDPLLTFDLYSEWIKAAGVGDYNERTQLVWTVKEKLPQTNLNNLKYLVAFLHEFAQYSDITKMSVNNIAIVIGPNLLWPKDEDADPLGMVTDTAIQRRLSELLIEQCHWFFPDLPETPQPSLPNSKSNNLIIPRSPSLNNSFSSSQSGPPLSPRGLPDTSSINSTGSAGSSGSSTVATPPLPKSREKPRDRDSDLPHPLADHALIEGVTFQMVDNKGSPTEGSPSPKTKKVPPPVAPYKPSHKPEGPVPPSTHIGLQRTNSSDPPSPAPKPRHGSSSSNNSFTGQGLGLTRTASGDRPLSTEVAGTIENGRLETTIESPHRPTPASRSKRIPTIPQADFHPPTPPVKPAMTPSKSGGRGPSRRAPPPPVSKKPSTPAPPPPSPAPLSSQYQEDENEISEL